MIHLYPNCNSSKFVGFKNICVDCATRSAADFKSAVKLKKEPSDFPPSYVEVWRELVHGEKKWRVGRKYNPVCGHPSVKDTQGKCIFCKIESRVDETKTPSKEDYIRNLERSVKDLRARADATEGIISAIRLGLHVPRQASLKSPRQFAIENGEKWYQHDEPCSRCGVLSERYVANGRCRSCGK